MNSAHQKESSMAVLDSHTSCHYDLSSLHHNLILSSLIYTFPLIIDFLGGLIIIFQKLLESTVSWIYLDFTVSMSSLVFVNFFFVWVIFGTSFCVQRRQYRFE